MDAAPARDADAEGPPVDGPGDAAGDGAGDGAGTDERPAPRRGSRRPSRGVAALAAVLVVVLVAGVVIAVIRGRQVHDQDQLDANRAAALGAAEQFALRMDAFDGADLAAYTQSVEPLLTTKEKTVFGQQLKQFSQLYEQVQKASKSTKTPQPGTGSIVMGGVSDVDADSATVLVAHDSTIPGSSQKLHSRWTISMRKIGDRWLVDSFTPVA